MERRFKVQSDIGNKSVYVDRFAGPYDLIAVCKERTCAKGLWHNDFFNGAARPSNPGWSGFEDPSQLWGWLEHGIEDDKLTRDAIAYANAARVTEEEKLRDVSRNVYGGAVIVPAVMAGDPRAMWCVNRKPVRSKVIRLSIDLSVTYNYPAQAYERAGRAVVRTVARLEKAGYRVAVEVAVCSALKRNKIVAMVMPIKSSGEVMNFRRMLYPLTDPSFFRGVGFGWMVRHPRMNANETGLGISLNNTFARYEREDKLEETYEGIFGPGSTVICLRDLADRRTEDDAARWLEAKMLDAEAM